MYMNKIIYYNKENINKFYKRIWIYKVICALRKKIILNYCGKEYKSIKTCPKDIVEVLKCIEILNERNKKKRLELVYDYTCEYLDNEFLGKNLCGFKNDMCACNRHKHKDKRRSSCCESGRTKTICDKFDNKNKECTIKSISCKLFVCPYLRKKGVKLSVNNVPY